MLDDPEVAERLAAEPEPKGPSRPSLAEYSPDVARLDTIADLLGEVLRAIVGTGGGKPPNIRPAPRPSTGVERAREQMAKKQHLSLVAEVQEAQARWARNKEREG